MLATNRARLRAVHKLDRLGVAGTCSVPMARPPDPHGQKHSGGKESNCTHHVGSYGFKKVLADVVAVILLVLTVAGLLALTIVLAAKAS